jgi:DNA-binding PadR family transcriptional regulator
MARRPFSNPLALAVLSSLWQRPMYPYEITTTLREQGKEDSIRLNFGSLYAVIKSLEKHGFIEATHSERKGNRPERTVYAITDAGRQETTDWLRELIEQPKNEYPAIETGLSLVAILHPDEALALLRRRAELLTADIEQREELAASPEVGKIPELFMVEANYKVAMLAAERDFVAALADRLEKGEIGGQQMWLRMHDLLADGHSLADLQDDLADYFGQEVADLLNDGNREK